MKYIKLYESFNEKQYATIFKNGLVNDKQEFIDLAKENGIDELVMSKYLNLEDRAEFQLFVDIVNKYWTDSNGISRTTYGYTFEIDTQYEEILKEMGIDWYTRERISNIDHPRNGQAYLEFDMMEPEFEDKRKH